MSNKSPLPSSPCEVCTGWIQCRLKAIVCWAQERLEFLCERNYSAPLSMGERLYLADDWNRFHAERRKDVVSERCMKADYTSRAAFKDWLDCATAHGFIPSPETLRIVRGRLTITNRFGLLPTTGLSCMCCAGYRVWFALVLGAVIGKII